MSTTARHEEFLELLPDLILGRLKEDASVHLLAHLAQCRDCAEAKTTLELLASREPDERPIGWAGHPSTEEMVTLAVEPSSLDAAKRRELSSHLVACPACREQAEATREAGRHVLPHLEAPARRRRAGPYLAAAALLLLLVYPTYLGLLRLPEAKRDVARLEESLASMEHQLEDARRGLIQLKDWGSAVSLPVLRSAPRGEPAVQELRLRADQPLLALGVELLPPADASASSAVNFELRAEGQQPVWTGRMPMSEARESLSRSGMIILLVPVSALGEGGWMLDVVLLEPNGHEQLLSRIAFRLKWALDIYSQSPAATKAPQ